MRRVGAVGLLAACVATGATVAGAARAQGTGSDAAAAAALFEQGRQALQDKHYDEACARLTESQRLDPKVGTLINLALCEQGAGRLAKSLQRWDDAASLAHTTADRREPYIAEQRAALAPRVPHLAIRLAPDAPAGTHVRLDEDGDLAPASLTVPVAVDPGAHVVTATAPGRADRAFRVSVPEGASAELVVTPGDAVPSDAAAAAPAPTPAPEASSGGGTQRMLAYVSAGLGVAGVAAGTVLGLQAISARNDPNCSNGVCSSTADAQLQHDGVVAGDWSTVSFIAGGALLATGAVLWLMAPKRTAAARPSAAWLGVAPSRGGAVAGIGASW